MRRGLACGVAALAAIVVSCGSHRDVGTRCDLVALDIRAFGARSENSTGVDELTKALDDAGPLTAHETRLANALAGRVGGQDYASIYALCRSIETGAAAS